MSAGGVSVTLPASTSDVFAVPLMVGLSDMSDPSLKSDDSDADAGRDPGDSGIDSPIDVLVSIRRLVRRLAVVDVGEVGVVKAAKPSDFRRMSMSRATPAVSEPVSSDPILSEVGITERVSALGRARRARRLMLSPFLSFSSKLSRTDVSSVSWAEASA